MKTSFEDILQNALDGMSSGPRALVDAISFYAKQEQFGGLLQNKNSSEDFRTIQTMKPGSSSSGI